MAEPELFVVCKNCSEPVSPYVTECPYCGQRVRKRAPKLDRGTPKEPRRRRAGNRLPKLRRDEIPGIAPDDKRPVATWGLVLASLVTTILIRTGEFTFDGLGGIVIDPGDEMWRVVTTPFLHDNLGYQFIALVGVWLFGMHLERRFGLITPVSIFLLAGAAGAAAAVAAGEFPALGANGAALGMLAAWWVEDRLALRRGDDRENDMLGVAVIAAMLALLPLADADASWVAGGAGALAGAGLGAVLGNFRTAG